MWIEICVVNFPGLFNRLMGKKNRGITWMIDKLINTIFIIPCGFNYADEEIHEIYEN